MQQQAPAIPPPPPASSLTRLQRLAGWIRRRTQSGIPPPQIGPAIRSGNAALAQASTLTAIATSKIDLANLWAVYLNAKLAADQATELYFEARMAGGSMMSGVYTYYGVAYQLQLAAGQAYEIWYAAWRRINPAPPSGPPQAPPDFPALF